MTQYIRLIFVSIVFLITSYTYSQPYDAYEIYSTIVNNKEINWTNKNTILVIKNVKLDDSHREFLEELNVNPDMILSMSYFDNESAKKYMTDRNYKDAILGLLKTSTQKINVKSFKHAIFNLKSISKRKFYSFFKQDIDKGWNKINEKYQSNWVIEFSEVSFSGNYAAVYYGYYCGGLCGSGQLLVLEKKSTDWEMISNINLWMH